MEGKIIVVKAGKEGADDPRTAYRSGAEKIKLAKEDGAVSRQEKNFVVLIDEIAFLFLYLSTGHLQENKCDLQYFP